MTTTPSADFLNFLNGTTMGKKDPGGMSNLISMLNASPDLASQYQALWANKKMTDIVSAPLNGAGAQANRSAGTVTFNNAGAVNIDNINLTKNGDVGTLITIAAHEGAHLGFTSPNPTALSDADFSSQVQSAFSAGGTRDFTSLIQRNQLYHSLDESNSMLVAWNAYVNYMKTAQPNATLADLYTNNLYARFYMDVSAGANTLSYSFKSNLTVNSDNTISITSSNLQAEANNYYYSPSALLAGNIGYANTNGDWELSDLAALANGRPFTVDFQAAGLDPMKVLKAANQPGDYPIPTCNITDSSSGTTYVFQGSGSGTTLAATTTTLNTDGSRVLDTRNYGTDSSLSSEVLTNYNSGNTSGMPDSIVSKTTGQAGSAVDTENFKSGTLTNENRVVTSSDGKSVTTWIDSNGDGKPDEIDNVVYQDSTHSTVVSVATSTYNYASGTVSTTTFNYNPGIGNGLKTVDQETSTINGGSAIGEVSATETTSGAILSANISGSGMSVNAVNANIVVAAGASATLTGYGDTVTEGNGATLTTTGTDTVKTAEGTLSVTGLNRIITSADGQKVQDQQLSFGSGPIDWVDYSGGVKTDQIDFKNGNEIDQKFFNSAGQMTAQALFDGQIRQTDYLVYDPASGQETQDQQINVANGSVLDWLNFSNGVKTDQIDFQNNIEVDRKFFNPTGQMTGEALFNGKVQQTDYLIFDPTSGQETQDRQLNATTSAVLDWVNYSKGVKTDQIDFGTGGFETDQKFYNMAGALINETLFTTINGAVLQTDYETFGAGGQLTQDRQFNAATGAFVALVNYSNGVKTDQADYVNGQQTDRKFFNAAGQMTDEALLNSQGQQTDSLTFNTTNGQLKQDQQFNTKTGTIIDVLEYSNGNKTDQIDYQNGNAVDQKFFNSAGQMTNEALFNNQQQQTDYLVFNPANGQETQDRQFNPTTATATAWVDYSNGIKTDQQDFQNGNEVDQKFFNSAGQLTSEALFNSKLQQTDMLIFNTGTGALQQDKQADVSTGKLCDAIDYNASGQKVDQLNFNGAGVCTDEVLFNGAGQKTDDAVFNSAGKQTDDLIYNTATGALMQDQQMNTSTGQVQDAIDYNAAGQRVDQLNFNASGQLTDEVNFSSPPPTPGPTPPVVDTPVNTNVGGYSGGFDVGGFDFGFYGLSTAPSTAGAAQSTQNISGLLQDALSKGNTAAANAMEAGMREASLQASGKGSTSAVLEGARWASNQVITWSLATSAGTATSPFSGYLDSSYEKTVQNAFAAWSKATGLTFKEVTDSTATDIRIGWGSFDTAHTGILGFTSFQASATGQIAADAIVRLENPGQDAFMVGSDGQAQTYTGTQATLYQTLLHEIGHALGFASNADASSIMNYQLTAKNRTLDSTDVLGGLSLYQGQAATTAANVNQLLQAIASFAPPPAGQTSVLAANNPSATQPLLATAH